MLFRNLLLAALAKTDVAALIADMAEVTWGPGEVLYEAGAPVAAAHFPSSAILSTIAVLKDDTAVECATVGYEGAVGVLAALSGNVSSIRVVAQIAGTGISIPAAALRRRAAESPELKSVLLRFAEAAIAQQEASIACSAVHGVTPRLARWLLQSQDRLNTRSMHLTQENLATMLGVQRTTVSAAAGLLRDEKLVRYSRGQVEILDRPALERRACGCYGSIRQMRETLLAPR